jgi:hypothetical protein
MKSVTAIGSVVTIGIVFAVLGTARSIVWAEGPEYELVGPPETGQLESTLGKRLGVYAWGIWPRAEKLEKGIPGAKLPKQYVQRIREWAQIIVTKDLFPDAMDPNQWYGLPKANGYNNFIVGEWDNADETVRVQFRATGLLFVVTATSSQYFPDGPGGLTDQQIVKAITALTNYPDDKVGDIAVEKHLEEMGDPNHRVLVCYGKLSAPRPTVKRYGSEEKEIRTWWSDMQFWVTKNRVFFSCSMVNCESFPASLDPYVFKF